MIVGVATVVSCLNTGWSDFIAMVQYDLDVHILAFRRD